MVSLKDGAELWAGIIREGHKMPLNPGYSADLYGKVWRNQLQPLILSNTGDVIWSEEPYRFEYAEGMVKVDKAYATIDHKKAGTTLKEAFEYASANYFPPSGQMPPEAFFSIPQYNTWIELTYNQNQADVLAYARGIIENGLPPGIIMIDDTWQEDYGKWNFHPGKFPDPKAMMAELHQMGFKVMLWVCPFVSADSDEFRALAPKGGFMRDKNGQPAMVKWWNGYSALVDLTAASGEAWFTGELDRLTKEYGVDGFKLDAGDARFYVDLVSDKDIGPNGHSERFAQIGLNYPFNEYRATWKMGGQALVQRLHDKNHDWRDLQKLIPHMTLTGLMGYPFSCPDMIGGGQYTSFLEGAVMDEDLVVRSTQVHALMPMMQFSVAPWRILGQKHFNAVKEAVNIREGFTDYILALAKKAAKTGAPIVRPMEFDFPNQGFARVNDQFMLGDKVLVAPLLEKGEGTRTVVLPKGRWKSDLGKTYRGGRTITVQVPLERLPYFERIK
ncbi:glycoside hydrolase family 31 protein [Sediminicola luteus]|nr:glycoside hydrolase family 31 protein [Sediminicola luteus]